MQRLQLTTISGKPEQKTEVLHSTMNQDFVVFWHSLQFQTLSCTKVQNTTFNTHCLKLFQNAQHKMLS